MQCRSDEPSLSWTEILVQSHMPDYSLNWTARYSVIQEEQRCQCCSSTTRRWPSQSQGPVGFESGISFDTLSGTNVCVHMIVYICVCVRTYVCVYLFVYVHRYGYICVCIYIYNIYIYIYICICPCVCVYMYASKYIHTYIFVCVYIYKYIYMHTF